MEMIPQVGANPIQSKKTPQKKPLSEDSSPQRRELMLFGDQIKLL